ncbi:hypothetical protein [Aquimarina sp. RZ0]|uniref:hypothetical protein n=1 Tax=Aquimarina sp. RZ0 TaxID=2607730 RepID=UPI0011F381C3|nr:hypothetical protein [Aquimarina sp. RZ0]KAA1241599.1 hypothetical protein F0000_26300 [Aquimarina sp. RZ0]
MQKTTLEKQFNAKNMTQKYNHIWNKGIHLFTINDRNRDFYYSVFYLDFLFAEVIYNKLNGEIITIKSFSDKAKLMFYLREDFC